MTPKRIAINGFGRIGRQFLRMALERPELDLVAVNDLGDLENLAYLMRYDSAYGRSKLDVKTMPGKLIVSGKEIAFLQEKDAAKLPWKDLKIDIVVESTGFYDSKEKSQAHIDAGAKRVVISAPANADTILIGVNESDLATCAISSNGSCTTNASSPVVQILHETLGIDKAMLSTVHAYTAVEKLVDGPDAKDWRRGRAAAVNIIPFATGAAHSVTQAVKDLAGKFDGLALRVPILTGSISDLTMLVKRPTTVEEVNNILGGAARTTRWEQVLEVTDEPLVSSDIVGNTHASIVDSALTRVVGGTLVKVLAWYDNEAGYTASLVLHVVKAASHL